MTTMEATIIPFGRRADMLAAVRKTPQKQNATARAPRSSSELALMEDRKKRNLAWHRAEVARRLMENLDSAATTLEVAMRVKVDGARAIKLPLTRTEAHSAFSMALCEQLRTPAAYEAHFCWKERVWQRSKLYVQHHGLSAEEFQEILAADRQFLDACPVKGGRKRRGSQ